MELKTTKKADFTTGPLLKKMILFAIPIMISGMLQLTYSAADSMVVGKFSGNENALAAVGSTSTIYTVLVNFVIGLATGTSVLAAQFIGAKDKENASKTVHTSISVAVLGGIIISVVGEIFTVPLLRVMSTNAEIFELATLYLRIIFLGAPGVVLFNFASCIIRASGDSRTPMLIPACTGVLNVGLNLVFVIFFDMSVAGVALATVIANYASGIVTLIFLMRRQDELRFEIKKARINATILKKIMLIGIPSAIQTSLTTFSNMVLQSAINTLPVATISGVAIGSTIEGYMFIITTSIYQSTVTCIGQNYGAKRLDRTRRVMGLSFALAAVTSFITASLIFIFSDPIISLFIDSGAQNRAAVMAAANERTSITTALFVLLGFANVFIGFLQGCGRSLGPMLAAIFYNVVLRVLWATFIFPLEPFNSVVGLFTIYPISWIVGIIILSIMTVRVYKKEKRRFSSIEGSSI